MKTSLSRLLPTILGLLSVLSGVVFAADQPYVGLGKQLAGNYEGVAGPGNKLRIVVQPARPVPDEQRFSVTVQGKYSGSNVREGWEEASGESQNRRA